MVDLDLLSMEFARKHPDAFSRALAQGTTGDVLDALASLPVATATAIASRLPVSRIRAVLAIDPNVVESWLAQGPFDDARKLVGQLPRENCLAMVNAMRDSDRRRKFLQYLKYPAHSLGSLVRDVPVHFRADVPATAALDELCAIGSEMPSFIAIVEPDGRYLGSLDLWRLLVTPAHSGPIRDYTISTPPLRPEMTQISAADSVHWHINNWLPVVDQQEHLLGAVSRASVFSAARIRGERVDSSGNVFGTLARDAVLLFGEILERTLGRRSRS